jgi:hypothetical protein
VFGTQKKLDVVDRDVNQVQYFLFLKQGYLLIFFILHVFLEQFHFSNQLLNPIFVLKMVNFHLKAIFLFCESFQCEFRKLKLFFDMFQSPDFLFADTINDSVDELKGFLPYVN